MKALVTGASGFIGSHLIDALLARGDEVTCLIHTAGCRDSLDARGLRMVEGDVTQPQTLDRAVEGADVVYHLAGLTAALRPRDLMRVNAEGTANLARACASRTTPPVLVFVSSLAAAGPSPADHVRSERDPPAPVSDYGRSKLAGERAAAAWAGEVPVSIVRPPMVFGPRDRASLPLFRMIARLRTHVVPGFARRPFSMIHAEELSRALVAVAGRGRRVAAPSPGDADADSAAGRYFVAHDERPTFHELGYLIARSLGRRRVFILQVPEAISYLVAGASQLSGRLRRRADPLNLDKIREATAGSWTCLTDALRRDAAFTPAAPLATRLDQTASWYRQSGWL